MTNLTLTTLETEITIMVLKESIIAGKGTYLSAESFTFDPVHGY